MVSMRDPQEVTDHCGSDRETKVQVGKDPTWVSAFTRLASMTLRLPRGQENSTGTQLKS